MSKEAFDQQAGIDWYNQLIIDGNAKDDALAAQAAQAAQIAALREALTEIGGQPLDAELGDDGPWGSSRDFVEGYDQCIRRARAALEMSGVVL